MSRWLPLLLILVVFAGCRELGVLPDHAEPYTLVASRDPGLKTLDQLLSVLARQRVVYVGETHTRVGHHRLQLKIIEGLWRQGVDLAIGMEAFQQPFQKWLDAWVAGRIDEQTLLEKTQWYERWRFDWRLYRPILRFAREHRIPVVALNVPRELTDQVSEKGLAGLDAQARARLPREIDRSDQAYRRRLLEVFNRHRGEEKGFERFLDVQYTWDEGMAEAVARYLKTHPDKTMVVLAGAGHIAWGSGIPNRVARRLPGIAQAIVLPADRGERPEEADYLVAVEQISLPPRALIGVTIEPAPGGLQVYGVTPGSGAEKAGLKKGDLITAIDGRPVDSYTAVRMALADHRPGDRVTLTLRRNGREMNRELELMGSPHGG